MDVHFNARKIKFEQLNALMDPILRSQSIRTANIFINLDDLLHSMHRPQTESEMIASNKNSSVQMTSNILNLAAHYREWILRRGIFPKVYLVYSSSYNGPFENSMFTEKYRSYFIGINALTNTKFGHLNSAIRSSIPFLEEICHYIEGVYLIDTLQMEPSVGPLILANNNPADWNLLITRDRYDYQYADYPKWAILYPDFGDTSVVITSQNLWSAIAAKESIEETVDYSSFSPSLYPLALSILGNKYRSLPRMHGCGWKTLYEVIHGAIKEHDRVPSIIMQELILQQLTLRLKPKKLQSLVDLVNTNLDCTDITRQMNRTGPITSSHLQAQIIDVPDYENLVNVDRSYFRNHHINIPFLTRQTPDFSKPFYFKKEGKS